MVNKKDVKNTVDNFEERQAKYAPVAKALREVYGELQWHPGQGGMDELVSCILSQNTNDTNRDRGFSALKDRYPTWQDVVDAPTDEVIDTIRPAGLANQKAPRIQNALEIIYAERGEYNIDFLADMDPEDAKTWLTNIKGIGPKTAAIVLCFAYDMPAFPVDTHVHRTGKRIGFLPEEITADRAHTVMEAIVPPSDYFAFHIYLIRHGRDTCNARTPHCERCPIAQHCDYYHSVFKNSGSE